MKYDPISLRAFSRNSPTQEIGPANSRDIEYITLKRTFYNIQNSTNLTLILLMNYKAPSFSRVTMILQNNSNKLMTKKNSQLIKLITSVIKGPKQELALGHKYIKQNHLGLK